MILLAIRFRMTPERPGSVETVPPSSTHFRSDAWPYVSLID